jgi:hypothetical protein
MRKLLIVILCMGMLAMSGTAFATSLTAEVILWKDRPSVIIKNFQFDERIYNSKTNRLKLMWRSSSITIDVKTVESMKFTKVNSKYDKVSTIFKNKTIDNFLIRRVANHAGYDTNCILTGISKYGPWKTTQSYMQKITFLPSNSVVSNQPSQTISKKVDRVILKNGDTISGKILTEVLNLKTSYGDLKFKISDVSVINLEGGSAQNIDSVILKVGDKVSGVLQNTTIKLKMNNGNEIVISKDKIKDIMFKK